MRQQSPSHLPAPHLPAPHLPAPHLLAIDGLRGIAVTSVLLYHLHAAALPGGYMGVDIFFVISGFVVSLSLPSAGTTNIFQLLRLFYARRAVRILPALYACVLITTLLSIAFLPYSWLSNTIDASAKAALLGYSNFVVASGDGDYFTPSAQFNPFTHTWSLAVEEQFYAVFPLLFLPFLTGHKNRSRGLFLLASAQSLAVAWLLHTTQQTAAFYLIFSRFWELGLGVLTYQIAAASPPKNSTLKKYGPQAWAGASLVCLAVIVFALMTPSRTPYPGSLLPCAATAVLLWLIRSQALAPLVNTWLTQPLLRYLGRISYSLYLWHWPIIVLLKWTCGITGTVPMLAAPVMALGAAALSYRYIETPPRRALSSGALTAGGAIGMAVLAIAATYPLEKNLWPLRTVASFSTVNRNKADWTPEITARSNASGCRLLREGTTSVYGSVTDFTRATRAGCAPAAGFQPTLFVIGDSHAWAYQSMLGIYVLGSGARARLYTLAGCAVLGVMSAKSPPCVSFLATSFADVTARARPGDYIFLPGLRIRRLTDLFAFFGEDSVRAQMANEAPWRAENLVSTLPQLRDLLKTGASVILEAPKPEFFAPNYRCADWYTLINPVCADRGTIPRAKIEAFRAPVMAQFQAVQQALPAIAVWDPLPILCPGPICSANEAGHPLFFDADHLSAFGNQKLAPYFIAFVHALPRPQARAYDRAPASGQMPNGDPR